MIGKINSINFTAKKAKATDNSTKQTIKVTPRKSQAKTDAFKKATIEAENINRALIQSKKVEKILYRGLEVSIMALDELVAGHEATEKIPERTADNKKIIQITDENGKIQKTMMYDYTIGMSTINDYEKGIKIIATQLDYECYLGYDFSKEKDGIISYKEGFFYRDSNLVRYDKDVVEQLGEDGDTIIGEQMLFKNEKLTHWSANGHKKYSINNQLAEHQEEMSVDYLDDGTMTIRKGTDIIDRDNYSIGEAYVYRDGKVQRYYKGGYVIDSNRTTEENIGFDWGEG